MRGAESRRKMSERAVRARWFEMLLFAVERGAVEARSQWRASLEEGEGGWEGAGVVWMYVR